MAMAKRQYKKNNPPTGTASVHTSGNSSLSASARTPPRRLTLRPKDLHHSSPRTELSSVQGCLLILILGTEVSPVLQQESSTFRVAPGSSQVERCVSTASLGVDRTILLQKERKDFIVSLRGRLVEWCVAENAKFLMQLGLDVHFICSHFGQKLFDLLFVAIVAVSMEPLVVVDESHRPGRRSCDCVHVYLIRYDVIFSRDMT